jgi:hypothetical protein
MLAGLKWGAITGVAVYVVSLAFDVLARALAGRGSGAINEHPVLLIPICGVIFALLFACSAAGYYTTRETGVVGHGVFAGVVVYATQFVLSKLYTPVAQAATTTTTPVTTASVIAQVIAGLLVVGIAACMGWLGARPVAQQYARRHAAPDEAPPAE